MEKKGVEAQMLDRQELKARAVRLAGVPEYYQLVIEDYPEAGTPEKAAAVFAWIDPVRGEEAGAAVELGPEGELIRWTRDLEWDREKEPALPDEYLEQCILNFVRTHASAAVDVFTYTTRQDEGDTIHYNRMQEALELPLPRSGFSVTVSRNGQITDYHYRGGVGHPFIPERILDREQARDQAIRCLGGWSLCFAHLTPSLYDVPAEGVYLVYAPSAWLISLDAVTGSQRRSGPVLEDAEAVEDQEEQSRWVPLRELVKRDAIHMEQVERDSPEMLLGIRPGDYELLRSMELEAGIIGRVWRRREGQTGELSADPATAVPSHKSTGISAEAYLRERTAGTIKARFWKASGRLQSFMTFEEQAGELRLSREEAMTKAVAFLLAVLPEAHVLLDLSEIDIGDLHNDESEEDRQDKRYVFHIRFAVQGIPLYMEQITVGVHAATGEVCHYLGPDFDLHELTRISAVPRITAEAAAAAAAEQLDVQLEWELNYPGCGRSPHYQLRYLPVQARSRRDIRFVDAMNGTVYGTLLPK
ncbi:DUF4901 domain-containing protein [Paenibacillus sp. JX-17]|uniref:DUF4901 domain-containing protein n=1 Tax=Paenibacillus lacisoli TaxID=3064525 RepID=A0ABT9CBY8_9BACL|nr:YcdB/YcdC domain-containing protein [Paenibacillus sp. JX-17]MDO7906385.1 DUF4901 domain-containing protein [Paenibacillus sp. JX-17]